MPAGSEESHRERKKRRTRAALAGAALRMFAEQGYAATSVAQIAETAGVAPRTFFTYFESKEAVLFEWLAEPLERLQWALAGRPHGGDALSEFRAWLVDDFAEVVNASVEADALVDRLVRDHTAGVAAYGLKLQARVEGWLEDALATDLGVRPDDPAVRLAAAALVAGFAKGPAAAPGPLDRESLVAHTDAALLFVTRGLAALDRPIPKGPRRQRRPEQPQR